ncbi:MAK10-like protein [Tanacetum coccineum]
MERFKNAIFKQCEGINSRMTEMFGLLKELMTSKTLEKILIREEAKFPITKNVNYISLTKGEEERSNMTKVTPDNTEKPTETEAEMPHKINEKLIKGLVNNNRFNNSRSGTRVGKKKGKEYKVSPGEPVYDAILKKKITKKEDIRGNSKIPCSIGDLKHVNALIDQGFDVNIMPYSTYKKLTDERPGETDVRLSLASHSYIYPLGIAEDVLVEVSEHVYPIDFVILDIKENEKRPCILGTPFLTTVKASIKFDKGTITLRSGKSKVSFHRIPDSSCATDKGVKNDIEPIAPTMIVNRLVLEWEEKIKLHLEREMKFNQWRSKNFKGKHPTLVATKEGMDDEGEVTLYMMRRSLEVLMKFHWMIIGGQFNQLSHVSSSLLSKPGEYKKGYLLEDKQIPSVEVFCIWKAFGGNTRDLGSFGEETDKTTDLHQHGSRISLQWLEMALQIERDAVTTMIKTVSQDSKTTNSTLVNFYDEKGISQNFSYPYTPEQNGVAERKNRTLIEAAITMLSGSLTTSTLLNQKDIHLMNIFILMNLLKVSSDQNDQPVQNDEILNDDHSEHSNHTNDEQIIDSLPNTKDIQISEHLSSLNTEDVLVQNTTIPSPPLPVLLMVTPAPQDRWSQDKHNELVNIIGNPGAGMLTRAMAKQLSAASAHECLFLDFLSEEEPKKVSEALKHPGWVDSMQDELNQFARNKVWTLVPAPYGKTIISSRWIFRNKGIKLE